MRSKANIKTHPLHPILVAFPIAFFIGTLLADILGQVLTEQSLWQTGTYLEMAGIAFALLAAVPGIIDYIYAVPPDSSAKKRAGTHGLINTTVVLIFAGTLIYRASSMPHPYIVIGMEAIGVLLMSIAGWMGGTLVYRNQIGVDIRYAEAGKWKELYLEQTTGNIEVATADELELSQMKLVHAGDKRIVLARTENGYVAFHDRCTHKGGSLAAGAMMCGTVQCPWHGSQFDVVTGAVIAGPATEKIATYRVSETGGKIYLHL